jgi:hypothetical protein
VEAGSDAVRVGGAVAGRVLLADHDGSSRLMVGYGPLSVRVEKAIENAGSSQDEAGEQPDQ